MANLFDQYRETLKSSAPAAQRQQQGAAALPRSGYVDARMKNELPIFTRSRVNFSPPGEITQLAVNSNQLILAVRTGTLLRIDLEHPENKQEIELSDASGRVHRLLQDPTGNHVIVTTTAGDNFYLNRASRKPRPLSKFKEHRIESVGWNLEHVQQNTTGEILVGTDLGVIIETELTSGDDNRFFSSTSVEQSVREVFDLGRRDGPVKVTGIEIVKLASSKATEYRYAVLVTTPARLYQFIGHIPSSADAPVFQHIFNAYDTKPPRFQELPGNFGHSSLQLFRGARQKPIQFAWMTGPGVFCGTIDISGSKTVDSVLVDAQLIDYPQGVDAPDKPPQQILLTEFHVMLLYYDRVRAMCILNQQLIDEDIFTERATTLTGLWRDPKKGSVWAHSHQNLFKYKLNRESRDVWKMYLEKGNFALAKEYSRDSKLHLDQVITKEAEDNFNKERYEDAASLYAQTKTPFEDVALKFIHASKQGALKQFLKTKLFTLQHSEQTQRTLLVTWLCELYLSHLGQLRDKQNETGDPFAMEEVKEEFQIFLATSELQETLKNVQNTIYDLISSHGDVENLVFFANLIKDYKRVITHHIQREDFTRALQALRNQPDQELYYVFSPLLMQHTPRDTVALWMEVGNSDNLDPKRLIPALVQCDTYWREATKYLEFCVENLGNRDQAIHNYLLALYVKHDPSNLLVYVESQGQRADTVCYDLKYALRLCSEHGHQRACVHIYTTMALYDEALQLALKVDVQLARQVAQLPEEDDELRRKLWLSIAKHVIQTDGDIAEAMGFLQDCPLLKIEDILPFFPDFVTIDHFKEALCGALRTHSEDIQNLQRDMDSAADAAQDIKGQIAATRNRFQLVQPSERCGVCNGAVMNEGRTFYVFPCSHLFHTDCLITQILPELSSRQQQEVINLQEDLQIIGEETASREQRQKREATRVALKTKLDDIVAAECLYCGDAMIRNVDAPFIAPGDFQREMDSWR